MLLYNCYAFSFVVVFFQSEEKSSLKKGPLINILWPCPGSALGGFWPKKSIQNVRVMRNYIPNKFGEYPSSDSVVKADYVFPYIYMH